MSRKPRQKAELAPRSPEKKRPKSLAKSTRLITGVRAGIAAGALGLLSALYITQSNNRDSATSPEPAAEFREVEEIVFGNVRFFFKEPTSIDSNEKIKFLGLLRRAYRKVRDLLGDEVMQFTVSLDCPIIFDRNLMDAVAKVEWKDLELRLQQVSGEPLILRPPAEVALKIKRYSEATLAHELVHLFAQPAGLWSEAFHEGQANAVAHILYPRDSDDKRLEQVATDPRVIFMFSRGMDYNIYDKDELKGGIQNKDLLLLARMRWSMEWRELHTQHPTFLKDFYTEIAHQRRSGKQNFGRSELHAIGKKVLPEFEPWYQEKMKSMHELGAMEDEQFVAMRISTSRTLLIANYRTHARQVGFSTHTPPYMSPVVPEVFLVYYFDDSTKKEEYYYPAEKTIDPHYALVDLPLEVLYNPRLRVMIGDRQVPLAD